MFRLSATKRPAKFQIRFIFRVLLLERIQFQWGGFFIFKAFDFARPFWIVYLTFLVALWSTYDATVEKQDINVSTPFLETKTYSGLSVRKLYLISLAANDFLQKIIDLGRKSEFYF